MIGTVETIIHRGNDNFIICAIRTKDMPESYKTAGFSTYDECIVKGNMSVIQNLEYDFEGKWVNDPRYGWQMNVTSYKEVLPDGDNAYALINYLQSEMFDGIGPALAERIVNKFQKDTLDIIQNNHTRLAEVSGISKKKAETIYQCYLKNANYQEIMMLLKPYGVSTKRILRIMEEYGDKAIEVIKNNPYSLCKKIDGFGFLIADKIALACNLKRRDIPRISECIKYVLEQYAMEKGNLYGDEKMLIAPVREYLNKEEDLRAYCINQFKINGHNFSNQELLFEIEKNKVQDGDIRVAMQIMHDNNEVVLEYNDVKALHDIENTPITKDSDVKIIRYLGKKIYKVEFNNQEYDINSVDFTPVDYACYLTKYYNAECEIAKNINRILYSKHKRSFVGSFSDIIDKLEKLNNITYAEKQKEAIMSVIKRNLFVITGGPGTGKTTLIKGIISLFNMLYPHSEIVLAAPTGRAAKRMEETTGNPSSTIHRLLEFVPGKGFNRNEDNPIDADLLIIDETSMVDVILCNALMKAISSQTKVVFVGDADQLPSVGPGMILKDMIQSKKITTVFLNEIFRQANTSKIVINAQKINNNDVTLEFGPDFLFEKVEKSEYPNDHIDMVVKKLCDLYKRELASHDNDPNKVQVLVPFRAKKVISVNELNKILEPIANPKPAGAIELKTGLNTYHIGDKVMQLKNNYDKGVFNGDIGYVQDIYKDFNGYKMIVDFDSTIVSYDEFDELTLAYASTIHKSQGSEYDVVIEPFLKEQFFFLQKCIVYTAITRAKKKFIGLGEYPALMQGITTNYIINRNTKLSQRIDEYDVSKFYSI